MEKYSSGDLSFGDWIHEVEGARAKYEAGPIRSHVNLDEHEVTWTNNDRKAVAHDDGAEHNARVEFWELIAPPLGHPLTESEQDRKINSRVPTTRYYQRTKIDAAHTAKDISDFLHSRVSLDNLRQPRPRIGP